MPNPEEYRRTRRIVDLLLRIANQPRRWTRKSLAELYEVSEKQMDKDLFLIRHGLRMPLRHVAEGYYFERLATLPMLSLTLSEALSLLLAARLGQQMPGVSRSDLAAAIARVEALLPPEIVPLVGALGRGEEGAGLRGSTLRELQLAIAERARLRMRYCSASGVHPLFVDEGLSEGGAQQADRLIDPYTLLPYLKSWYLIGMCHLRKEVRMFKVDRIQAIARTGEHFVLPEGCDLASYLGHTWGLLRGEAGAPEEVVLEFAPEAGRWVRDEEWHPSQRVEDLPDGRVRLIFYVGITPEMRRWVLGFGRQVKVVRPAHLAEWMVQEARAVLEVADTTDI